MPLINASRLFRVALARYRLSVPRAARRVNSPSARGTNRRNRL